jgi:ArsR family transcriptional regulator, lead/cadmium/zinc/bismuth-responsive transcriptional repressor
MCCIIHMNMYSYDEVMNVARQTVVDRCEVTVIHPEIVQEMKEKQLPNGTVLGLAEIFKTLGDPTRIRIMHLLNLKEMCVCDIAATLEMSQSAVSHQLRVLRNFRLVKHRRAGKSVFYTLDDDHIHGLFEQGLEHLQHP